MAGRLPLLAALAAGALGLLAAPAGAATIRVDVTNDELNDDGDCALREAVQSANENKAISGCAKGQTSSDKIVLKGSQYTITGAVSEDDNEAGDFDVVAAGSLIIEGKGPGETTVFQSGDDRVFELFTAAKLTMEDLRVSGGDVTSHDSPDDDGGNFLVKGSKLTLDNVDVTSGDASSGGAIFADQAGARVRISRGLLDSNDALTVGGTISLRTGTKATISRSTLQLSEVTSAAQNAAGGIIHNAGDGLKVFDSALQGSSADTAGAGNAAFGAAIYSSAPLVIKRSVLRGNTASAATDNTAENGGALYLNGDTTLIVNSTFFDNRAGGPGDNDGQGGAIFSSSVEVDVKHSTFDSNDASAEGDVFRALGGTLTVFGSIFDDGTDPCSGDSVVSSGFNVSESIDANCNFAGSDIVGGDPGLGVFADNGGPTETIAIQPTSDAKNLVSLKKCKQATGLEDQRGFTRPKGKKCDAGAFELGANP